MNTVQFHGYTASSIPQGQAHDVVAYGFAGGGRWTATFARGLAWDVIPAADAARRSVSTSALQLRGGCGNDYRMTVTAFQQRVYDAVARIPRGRVSTYKDIAARIGCGSPRAVGQALKKNPFAPRVPCHRVIASDLTIGGFQGEVAGAAIRRKLRLLEGEGVRFINGRLDESIRR